MVGKYVFQNDQRVPNRLGVDYKRNSMVLPISSLFV